MEPDEADVAALLAAAELWMRVEQPLANGGAAGEPVAVPASVAPAVALVAGWEDGHPACARHATDDGQEPCGAHPVPLVRQVLATRRAIRARCAAGVELLAFPAPRGSHASVGVLRLSAAPEARDGATSEARDGAAPSPGRAVLRAANRLRDPLALAAWQAQQRARAVERRRTAAAAIAQMVATTEEFQRRLMSADRDRASSARTASRLDILARETLHEAEDSRTRIAHELHDSAAQSMVSAFRFLEATRASLAGQRAPEVVGGHLDAAQERLLAAIREVRVVLNRLVPPGLEELGVGNALQIHLRDTIGERPILFTVTDQLPRTERWLEAGLYAMAREAIDNALVHGSPRSIRVDLLEARGRGIITVIDDGAGFDTTSARRRSGQGSGLVAMQRRAAWLGGRADVTSRPGDGTTVRFSVPLMHDVEGPGPDAIATANRERP